MRRTRWVGLLGLTLLYCCTMRPTIAQEPEGGVVIRSGVDRQWESTYILLVTTKSAQRAARIPRGVNNQTVEREAAISFRVKEFGAEEIHLVARYEWIRMKVTLDMPQMNLEFDARDPLANADGNPLAKMIPPIVGLEFDVYIDGEGEILAVQFPAGIAPVGQFANLALPLINSDAALEDLRPIFTLGAGIEPRKAGESWGEISVRVLPELGLDIRHSRDAKIERIEEEGLVRIGLTGSIGVERAENAQIARATVEQGEAEGRALWNTVARRLESFEERSTLGLVAEPQPGQVWRLEAITTTLLKREE